VTGTGSATAVAFWNGASSLAYDGGLYRDNTGKNLGVGTTAPGGETVELLSSGDLTFGPRWRHQQHGPQVHLQE
jgi:hypothetical protein